MNKYTFIILLTVILTVIACKHSPETLSTCVAGSGGNITMVVYANHNGVSIPNYFTHSDTSFVKYGTLVSPGTNPINYDTYFISTPGEDHIHCPGLKCGDYYIYQTAWDSVANVTRYGGKGISFSETSGDKVINVDVN